jgi:transposase
MKSIGMDVHMRQTYFCVLDKRGKLVERGHVMTTEKALSEVIERHADDKVQVALEASTITWWVQDILKKAGARVEVTNPYKLKLISESRSKTDKADAQILAELLRCGGLPTAVYVPSVEIRTLRQKLCLRRRLISIRTQVINAGKAHLRGQGIKSQPKDLHTVLSWKEKIDKTPESSWYLNPLFETYFQVQSELDKLEKKLLKEYGKDERIKRLRTIPGVGVTVSYTLLACLAEAKRFSSSKQVAAYAGLVPSQFSSGEVTNYGGITRQGRHELRGTLIQGAWGVLRTRKDSALYLKKFYYKLLHKKGKSQVAIVALARKILTIAYHVMKDEKDFEGSLTQTTKINRKEAA